MSFRIQNVTAVTIATALALATVAHSPIVWAKITAPPNTSQYSISSVDPATIRLIADLASKEAEEAVGEKIDDRIDRFEDKQLWFWGLFSAFATFTFIALAGLATVLFGNRMSDIKEEAVRIAKQETQSVVGNLATQIRDSILKDTVFRESVASIVAQDLGKDLGNTQIELERVRREVGFANLQALARKVQESDGFSNAERDALIAGLKEVVVDSRLTDRPEFMLALEHIFSSFGAASLHEYIDDLDDLAGPWIEKSPRTLTALILNVGMRRVGGDPVPPRIIERFEQLLEAANRLRIPEAIMGYEIVLRHASGEPSKVDSIKIDFESLTDDEKNYVRRWFDSILRNDPPDASFRRVKQKAARFVVERGEEFGIRSPEAPSGGR